MDTSHRLRRLLTALGAGYLGLAAWNGHVYRRTRALPFPPPLEGETGIYNWPGGRIFYTRRGRGEPLVLVHGIYAGADSHEFQYVFGPLAERYEVYAYDILGFGHSSRPNVRYSGALYVRLLADFIRDVVGRPANVVATSLSGGHAIVAASQERSLIRRLILEAPTGRTAPGRPSVARDAAYIALTLLPDLGEALLNAIASRASIRWYLRHMAFYDPGKVSEEVVEYCYRSAHQPGAQYPLVAFLTGRLDVPIEGALRSLVQPLALVWGRQARFTPVQEADWFLRVRPDAMLNVMEQTGSDAVRERPEEFVHVTLATLAHEGAAVAASRVGEKTAR